MGIIANVVWPSLYLSVRMQSAWIIGAGLVIEFFFILWLTKASIPRACLMTLAMNVVSTVVGIFGIPLSGLAWEFIATATVKPVFGWGTFNPVTWFASCVLAALLNAVIETGSLRLAFKTAWSKRLFWWLVVANLVTVGIAMVSIMQHPPVL